MPTAMRVFIGSSTEGLPVARAVHELLAKEGTLEPSLWNQGTFQLSRTYIESLETELANAHFAVLVLAPDDVVVSRQKRQQGPRDNVIFELGLFIGQLGRDRCFLLHDKDQPLKLPSDLLGVQPAEYSKAEGGGLRDGIASAVSMIADHARRVGPRALAPDSVRQSMALTAEFASRLVGAWWERFESMGAESVGFFTIAADPGTNGVRLWGDAYDASGTWEARWESVAVRLIAEQRKLFYSWQGSHPKSTKQAAEVYRGFGEFVFSDETGRFTRGVGTFSDVAGVSKRTEWKSVALRRAWNSDDVAKMVGGSVAERASAVLRARQEI